jgi:hypothetical protein
MQILAFTPATSPISTLVTKFGGQPVWVAEPMWPLSRASGRPMCFVCQVALPSGLQHGGQKMAYIFMTDDDTEYCDGTWEPEGGENAVILQPAPFECLVETSPLAVGPTLRKRVTEPQGFWGKLSGRAVASSLSDVELAVREVEADPNMNNVALQSRIGGEPGWLQNDETPPGGWKRLCLWIKTSGP